MGEREQRFSKEDDKQSRTKEGRVNPPRLEGSGERVPGGRVRVVVPRRVDHRQP
jgi:hypothetical protein